MSFCPLPVQQLVLDVISAMGSCTEYGIKRSGHKKISD